MWPAYVLLVASLATVAAAYLRIRSATAAYRQAQFDAAVEAVRSRAEIHFTYYLELLRGIRGLFAASDRVTPAEFRRYLDSIDLRSATNDRNLAHPELRDLGFAMRVREGEKAAHVEAMRENGFPDYRPLFLGDGPDHFPVAYMDDFREGGMVPSGWDPMGDPVRRSAMAQARDTGEPTATGPTEVFARKPDERAFGFVVYLPVYAGGSTPATVEERRELLQGFVFESLGSDELWRAVEGKGNGVVHLMIWEGQPLDPERRLYPRPDAPGTPQRVSEFIDGYSADGLGRTWNFLYTSRKEFEETPTRHAPLATLLGGVVLSLGLFSMAYILVRGRFEAERMTAELRTSEAQFRGIFDAIQDLYYRTDKAGYLTMVSPSCRAMLGYEPGEILGRSSTEGYADPEQRAEVVRRILAEGKLEDFELRLKRKDGALVTGSLTAHLVCDAEGRPCGTEGIIRDITLRKRSEAALRESHELYHSLVDTLPLGLFRKDVRGVYTYANRAFLELLGRPGDPVAGRTNTAWLPSPLAQKWDAEERGVVGTGARHEAIDDLAVPGRDPQRLRTVRLPIRDAAGAVVGIQGLCWDITEQQRLEAERLRSSKLESVGLLAGGIAHDFNNILTAIIGNVALIRLDAPPDRALQEQLGEVERAALRAKDLTQQLLTFAKGGAPVRKTASLTEVIRDSTLFALRGSNVRCEFTLPAELWPAEVDVGQLNQVIHNLVLNALQAMPEGGRLDIRAENARSERVPALGLPPGPYVHCSIADTGTGIRPEHLAKIFDPYFTTKQHGSGLGLATSYSIIKRHEGRLTVESELGRGTTFHLWLPASPLATLEKSAHTSPIASGQGRILVVDDEAPIRGLLSRSLRKLGYEPECVADGKEALAAIQVARLMKRPFSAVILDLTIPGGMGGEETFRLLREVEPDLRGVVSSGYSNDPVMAQHRSYGFHGVLAKPYRTEDLARVLSEVLSPGDSSAATGA